MFSLVAPQLAPLFPLPSMLILPRVPCRIARYCPLGFNLGGYR